MGKPLNGVGGVGVGKGFRAGECPAEDKASSFGEDTYEHWSAAGQHPRAPFRGPCWALTLMGTDLLLRCVVPLPGIRRFWR